MQSWFPMEQDSFHRTGNTFLLNCLSATLCLEEIYLELVYQVLTVNVNRMSFSYNLSCIQEQGTYAHWALQ